MTGGFPNLRRLKATKTPSKRGNNLSRAGRTFDPAFTAELV
jgi:hypothetical protein